jgi:hypothetical protein
MKKTLFAFYLIAIFLLACEKNDFAKMEKPVALESKNLTKHHSKMNRLRAFSKDGRLYTIHYSRQGLIDSVTITGDNEYTYKVFYNGSRIDSVNLIQNGRIASATNNYIYDGNLIMQIDRWSMRDAGQPYPFIWNIVYDKKKRVVSPMYFWTFTYDENDLVLSKITSNYPRTTSFFSYEFYPNPLYRDDLLFIFIEELGAIEYSFHKWTIKTESFNNGDFISYSNEYDDSGRLIKMAGIDNFGSRTTYEFFY